MTYKDLNIPKEWENTSSPNDACPSFIYKDYQIFIDDINVNERENQDWKRFSIFDLDQNMLLHTDNYNEVLTYINNK
tara:strand:- start:182 stop:412 length:231 start_codon:yes stop_codon:yes gene_type:complete